jgi:hypothetical protein
MAALSVQVPYPVFYDRDGTPLDNGNIYIGVANLDAVTNQIQVYYDEALTLTASQPLITSNGYVYRNGTPAQLYVNAANFSILVNDSKNLLVYNFPDGTGISPNASGIAYSPPFAGAVVQTVESKLEQYISVTDFIPLGTNTQTTDCAPYFQAAIDYCMNQYDPSETTHDGNNVFYMGQQKTLYIPVGRYSIASTLNMSFRNQIEMVGEDQWNSILEWSGAIDGMIIDARCSNYVKFRNFTLDGRHTALTFIYCAGNGVNAPTSKGNVTGNYFGHIYFWNQKGNLLPPYLDYEDTYNPLTAMLNTISIDTPTTFFNSMDDSVIEFCRFAPNSLNNFYAIGLSSSANVIKDCSIFSANGILCYNGAQFWMSDCISSMYPPQVQNSTHNHALIKFNYAAGGGSRFTDIELSQCYLESLDYYGGGHSVKLAFWAQGNVVSPEDEGVVNFLVTGGLYAGTSIPGAGYTYIDIQDRRRANIKLVDTSLQGPSKLYIYAPDSAVDISDQALSLTGFPQDTQTWQIIAANSVLHKYQTPEFQVQGAVTPNVNVTVGTTDLPGQLKFLSLDEALEFVSDCKGTVTIFLDQNDTVTRGGTLNGNVFIALQGFTLNINALLVNRGSLTISNSFVNNVRGGTVTSTTKFLSNNSALTIKNCTIDNAVTNDNGIVSLFNVEFSGTADSVLNDNAGTVMVDSDTCTFSGAGYVVNLGAKYGNAVAKSIAGTIPATGLWMRGTRLEFSNPSTGSPNQYWATANGIGVAANWANSGNLV